MSSSRESREKKLVHSSSSAELSTSSSPSWVEGAIGTLCCCLTWHKAARVVISDSRSGGKRHSKASLEPDDAGSEVMIRTRAIGMNLEAVGLSFTVPSPERQCQEWNTISQWCGHVIMRRTPHDAQRKVWGHHCIPSQYSVCFHRLRGATAVTGQRCTATSVRKRSSLK